MSDGVLLKGPVQQANETRRREGKTADKSVTSQETQISVTESLFDECLWSSHCTTVADVLVADELKPTNSVSKNGRRMRYSMADQHYLTCSIFRSVPPTKQKDKCFVVCQTGVVSTSSATIRLSIPSTKLLSSFTAF